MRNQWIGDIGDFGKYGLLRALCPGLRLGVVWYLVSKPKTPPAKINYLSPKCEELCNCSLCQENRGRFRECDEELWNALRTIVRSGQLSVKAIRDGGVLNGNGMEAIYYEDELTSTNRLAWASKAVSETAGCHVVFLDPDTGIWAWDPRKKRKEDPEKYVFLQELSDYLRRRDQSVIVYQHRWGGDKNAEQLFNKWERALDYFPELRERFCLIIRYDVGPVRIGFFIISSDQHREILSTRTRHLTEDPRWKQHFFGPYDGTGRQIL